MTNSPFRQVPINLIKEHHRFTFPTYYSSKNYRELACPADAPSNTLIRIPGDGEFGQPELE